MSGTAKSGSIPSMAGEIRVATMVDNLIPGGGAERIATELLLRLDRIRFSPYAIVTRPLLGQAADAVRAAGVPVLVLDRQHRRDLLAWKPAFRLLRRERIDVLHCHKFGSNVWGSIIGPLSGVPVVVSHEHSWSYEGAPLRRLLDRQVVARGSKLLLAVSRADERRMHEVEGIPRERTRFVQLGIPPLGTVARDVRAELGIAADAPVVGTVCGLWPVKRLEDLVAAARLLRGEFPALEVLVAGTGPEREQLEALADGAPVRFLGFWPPVELASLLAALDVGVNCSDSEGSPLFVMELMAAGKALVASRVGGTPDLVDDGVHGLLVPPRDPRALALAIGSLLGDPARRAELGARARERQRAELDVDVFVRRIEAVYEELLARHGATKADLRGHGAHTVQR